MFELRFETTNDTFQGPEGYQEVAFTLEGVASRLLEGNVTAGTIRDSNGNTIGSWALTEDGEDRAQTEEERRESADRRALARLHESGREDGEE